MQAARADHERLQNEAQTYSNRSVPDARGRASQIVAGANAYHAACDRRSRGQSAPLQPRSTTSYKTAPDVTRQRIYLETMERILGNAEKLIYDGGGSSGGQGVVPFLPLNELTPRRQPPAAGQQQSGATR